MTPSSTDPKHFVFTQGVLFGTLLGLYQAINFAIGTTIESGQTYFIVNSVAILVSLSTYLFVGIRASRQTGKVVSGLLTSMWTALFSSIIYCWTYFVAALALI